MPLPTQHTKIVCTIGPASANRETLTRMMRAGMNVCRLNFAHGDFDSHAATIRLVRDTAAAIGHRITIYADMPGPKIRLGSIAGGRCSLEQGARVTLTTEAVEGSAERLAVQFAELPAAVTPGDRIFLNDGFLQLTVEAIGGTDIRCHVDVGGPLFSNKGVNIPDKELPIKAFTPHDREILEFAVAHGADVVSQSFVQNADDLWEVREAARTAGGDPLIFGKIERAVALENIDAILAAADGIMVARGDLGVETPIEGIALAQKHLIRKARAAGKLVITATQMLESMVSNPRPTRAEATDVANAILDGTDCVMLSEESAMGRYPVESAAMLASIAHATEAALGDPDLWHAVPDPTFVQMRAGEGEDVNVEDVVAASAAAAVRRLGARIVIVPTVSGLQARLLASHRFPCRIVAFSPNPRTCQELNLCFGVIPVDLPEGSLEWEAAAEAWCRENGVSDGIAVIAHRWARGRPTGTNRLEIVDIATYFAVS